MEPVAPRTLTVRTADAAALLLRKGTALIFSPNHKTAADAIHAAPEKAQNRRQRTCRDKTVETIQQPAMARNDMAGVLDAESAFDSRFEQVAKLGYNRERSSDQKQRQERTGFARAEFGEACGDN
jgi:hypothetical protein